MKRAKRLTDQRLNPAETPGAIASSAPVPSPEVSAAVPAISDGIHADHELVKRCLSGEVNAWEDLYAQCHEPLLASVRVMLGGQAADGNLVDELAARVWYAVVANDGALLAQYDPNRNARLTTFLRLVARDEIGRHFRAERRRQRHEAGAAAERPLIHSSVAVESALMMADFLRTLTPSERAFADEHLFAGSPSTAAGQPKPQSFLSLDNIRQLRHRVREKLSEFIRRHRTG